MLETQISSIVEDVFNAQSNCSWNCVITPNEDAAIPIKPLTILYVTLCSSIMIFILEEVQAQAQAVAQRMQMLRLQKPSLQAWQSERDDSTLRCRSDQATNLLR